MNDNIKGTKILLIATAFFGYEKVMQKSLERLGAEVKYYDERSIKNQFEKAILKLSPSIFRKRTEKYYESIVEENKDEFFDTIYVYGATMIDHTIISLLREGLKYRRMILYLADSVKENKRYESIFPFFDKISTFDTGDYNYYKDRFPQMSFLPLFYSDDYVLDKNDISEDYQYDIVFVGTIHSDRMQFLDKIKDQAEKLNLKTYFYCYLQGKFMYWFRYLTNKSFRKKKISDFNYNKLSSKEVRNIIQKSRSVVDAQYSRNKGLTMRTFETLGMRKKLITTNDDILNYDFYNPSNILVVDRNNPQLSEDFFLGKYVDNSEIISKYHVDQWAINLFS